MARVVEFVIADLVGIRVSERGCENSHLINSLLRSGGKSCSGALHHAVSDSVSRRWAALTENRE